MKTVLITGATGYVGNHLVDHYLAKGYQVVACARTEDTLKELKEAHPNGPLTTESLDMTDAARTLAVVQQYQPDIVIHAAAIPRRKTAGEADASLPFEQTPLYQLNVQGACNLATALAQTPHPAHLCFVSSGAVFKQALDHVDLDSPRDLEDPFARSKNIAENLFEPILRQAPHLRSSILYSPVILDRSQVKGIIPMAADKALRGETIENNAPADASINMLTSDDFCRMVDHVTEQQTTAFERYPINGYRITIPGLLNKVAEHAGAISGAPVAVVQGETRANGMPLVDESKVRTLLGPEFEWQSTEAILHDIVGLQAQRINEASTDTWSKLVNGQERGSRKIG